MATSEDFDRAALDALVDEAVMDAYGEDEEEVGLLTLIQDNVRFPFHTTMLGARLKVTGVDVRDRGGLVAICERDKTRQLVDLRDLPLPAELPEGGEWILAYRHWAKHR